METRIFKLDGNREEGGDTLAYRALWCGVLWNMWCDAFPEDQRYGAPECQDARRWFGSKGYREVCALVGMDPDALLYRFKAVVVAGVPPKNVKRKPRGRASPTHKRHGQGAML